MPVPDTPAGARERAKRHKNYQTKYEQTSNIGANLAQLRTQPVIIQQFAHHPQRARSYKRACRATDHPTDDNCDAVQHQQFRPLIATAP